MSTRSTSEKAALAILALGTLVCASAFAATPVDVSQSPVFINTNVEPNIILGIDDSGSMDFEVLAPTNDGAYWWNTSTQSFVGCDRNNQCTNTTGSDTFNFNKTGGFGHGGVWNKYAYLFAFPNAHLRNSGYNSKTRGGHYFIAPIPAFAWARSPDYNNAYFDPSVTYAPWEHSNGSSYPNIKPTAAPDDPYLHPGTTVDLTSAMQDSSHGFMLMKGMTLPAGAIVENDCNGSWKPLTTAEAITSNDTYDCIEYFPATFWLQAATPAAALARLPAGYGYLLTDVIAGGTGPAGEPMFGFEIKPANFSSGAEYNAAMQNFANWFSYYRKRHLALRASLSQTFMNLEGARVGMTYMNHLHAVTMYDMNSAADKQSLFTKFFDDAGSGGTPTWNLLNYIGQQYERTNAGAPITQACQKNFTIIFTDGYASYPYAHSSPVGSTNVDSAMGSPYADSVGGTLGDVAAYYYLHNLRPDLTTGLVTPDAGCSATPPQKGADCNTNLHMDTYGVTLVPRGLVWNVNMPATNDPFDNPPPWPAASAFANRSPTGIDDLWHATLDGHGEMLAAQTPQLIAEKLQAVLNSISGHTGSDSSVAANSSSLNTKTNVYQASFQSSNWTGNLIAYKLDANGNVLLGSPLWAAQPLLDAQTAGNGWNTKRIIATWNPASNKGVPFEWGSISATQQADLEPSDTLGADRLNYLRGDRSNEQPNGDGFRSRTHILGDIVDSAPLFVGPPNGPYQEPSYISFELAHAHRTPMLYVGANDGMLHAFDPTTGKEKFAYVPNGVFQNLQQLTSTTYDQSHHYFVDGSPISGDVQFGNGSWHSILVGGLDAGGNSIYALDVTDPSAINSESSLASDVLWEFTGPKMGLSFSQPFIALTSVASTYSSTPFLVFFGSGYDNSDGNPYLYAVNAQTGALIKRINLCASVTPNPCNASLPNGLSSPVAVNSSGALAMPDDTVYAGDLQGNLWKVDISDPNPANWKVQLLFQARDAAGNPQPIMDAPVVSLHPDFPREGGTIVYFGTGQLLGVPDLSTTSAQSFYGVWDKPGLNTVLTRSNLVQDVLSTPTPGPSGTLVRTVSGPSSINWASKDGWYMNLSISGERVVSNPRLENGAVVFTTYIPTSNVCAVGGAAWLMAVNFKTGGSFPDPELDINDDGKLDSGDQVNGANPVGLYLGSVYAASPTIISASLGNIKAVKLVSESNGTIKSVRQHGAQSQRQSWRELPPGG